MKNNEATLPAKTFTKFWLPVIALAIAAIVITLDATGITDSRRQIWEFFSGTDSEKEKRVREGDFDPERTQELLDRVKQKSSPVKMTVPPVDPIENIEGNSSAGDNAVERDGGA